MEKKGQSALEYLMTYGWALIVIAIVIGVLVFIMSTTTAGSNCTSDNTQIIYVDHTVSGGALTLKLQNGAGKTIDISAIDGNGDFTGTGTSDFDKPVSGQEFKITGITKTGATTGTYRGTVIITYERDAGITHKASLTCSGTAA